MGTPTERAQPSLFQSCSNIDLKIPAGSTLAIVGPTGSGKTTLAALIARLWEAPPGQLYLDGKPLREWPLASLRGSIGFVPQDTYLFGETHWREYMRLDCRSSPRRQVREAADIAESRRRHSGLSEDATKRWSENAGITLSGGQKQRTAIARAVVRDPRILILDDALSSVDTQTEEHILSRLKTIMAGRTTILISHRTSTVRDADQIVVLLGGQIAERGTHEELLAAGGYYADLYHKQLLEEELERA